MVVDGCGECGEGDINVSEPLYYKLTGGDRSSPSFSPSAFLSFEFTDCSPYINDTIKMVVKKGGSAYYQALNFANTKQPIVAVQVNGQTLRRGTDNYFAWNPSAPINPNTLFAVALLGENREVLRARLSSADLGVQFSSVASPASNGNTTPAPAPADSNSTTPKGE